MEVRPIKHECPYEGCDFEFSILPSGNLHAGYGAASDEWERRCPKCSRVSEVSYEFKTNFGGTYPEFVGCKLETITKLSA